MEFSLFTYIYCNIAILQYIGAARQIVLPDTDRDTWWHCTTETSGCGKNNLQHFGIPIPALDVMAPRRDSTSSYRRQLLDTRTARHAQAN
jgi:hypothetical protein